LGADKSNEDNWLSHQLEFDDLLSRLNDHSENGDGEKPTKKRKKHEMEKTARQSRKRVFYNRFIQSKDLSSKSAEDMACIFGQRSKSVPGTPREQSEGEESDGSTASCPPPSFHGVQTVNSGQNIQEYFEMKMREMKVAREGKEMRGETAAQEEMVTGEARKDGSENAEFADEELKSKKKKKEKRRKRKACELKNDETSSNFDEDEYAVKEKKKNAEVEGWESGEGKECKVLKETKREKRKKNKGKEQEFIASQVCEIKEVQGEMIESLETEESVKGGKKKDKKKRKKDKASIAEDLEMSCKIEERNDHKDTLKKARNSNMEKTCKEPLPEAEETGDKRKKTSRKDKDTLSLDVEAVEIIEIKKEKKKKKKKVK